jgi:hypothetical protein
VDDGHWAIRFWRLLPLLHLTNAGFLLFFLSFPGNLVPALVFSVLGLGHIGADKFVGGTISGSDRVHLKPAD